MIVPDIELLRGYAFDAAESSFSELVHRHLDVVYSTALRQVGGDEAMARDIAQTVFSDLARKARLLVDRASLAGWLYTSTHYLQDDAKLKSIRSVIQDSATEAAQQGLLYSADPRNESDDWKRQRHELDRKATRAVQSLLTESELRLFNSRFLGALVMDLTPGRWDPAFEFIDPTLRGVAPGDREKAVLEHSPATGTLVPVAPLP